ncbi:SMAD6 [Cordylochernes scorpioides]|uniref:SMAD6 n=1 Tax=Cordylochernes scorpioides TaxID=51811 RepID=A0ABY6LRM8_9ARAC|nr:SMAD6 [Cordylochernes scorpioides]
MVDMATDWNHFQEKERKVSGLDDGEQLRDQKSSVHFVKSPLQVTQPSKVVNNWRYLVNLTMAQETADYPPPPYSSVCPQTKLENHEYETREAESSVGEEAATGDVDSFNHPVYGEAWCILAYWEMLERVGPLVPVWLDNMDVYYDLPQEEGLRLRPLMEARPSNAPACVLKTLRDAYGSQQYIDR